MRTKQTPRGSSSSHRPKGMATVRLTGSAEGEAEQFQDAGGDKSQDSQEWPDCDNPKAAKQGRGESSKTKGKTGDQPTQAEDGAEALPKENPPAAVPSDPWTGTSQDTPAVYTPRLPPRIPCATHPGSHPGPCHRGYTPMHTKYIKTYQQAGKDWLDTILVNGEQAYNSLFAELVRLGHPHIDNFSNADRQTVLKCIKDLTGRFLSEEDFTVYVEREDVDIKKPKIKLTGDVKEASLCPGSPIPV